MFSTHEVDRYRFTWMTPGGASEYYSIFKIVSYSILSLYRYQFITSAYLCVICVNHLLSMKEFGWLMH